MNKSLHAARPSQAGSLESSDCLVTVTPGKEGSGVTIAIKSIVMNQFGDQIRKTVEQTIAEAGIKDVTVDVNDRGALDFVLRSRILTAIQRSLGNLEEKES